MIYDEEGLRGKVYEAVDCLLEAYMAAVTSESDVDLSTLIQARTTLLHIAIMRYVATQSD